LFLNLDHLVLSTAGDKKLHRSQKNLDWATGTPVVNVMVVASNRIASLVE